MAGWKQRTGFTVLAVAGACALVFTLPALAKVVRGTPDGDKLSGSAKSDRLNGRAGDDELNGRKGGDILKAGRDDDLLVGGKGFDDLRGAKGDDVIRARDGEPDIIDCGTGFDVAIVDPVEDGVFDCEEVREP